jgi:hypothetical protein
LRLSGRCFGTGPRAPIENLQPVQRMENPYTI